MSADKIQILSRWDSTNVLFECDAPEGLESGLRMRHALEKAVEARADLAGAYLAGADLARANLAGAYLAGANLARANLAGANLAGAYLAGAYLAGANLAGAYLAGAYLAGAKLRDDLMLIGRRPVLVIGPIGSRGDNLLAFLTDKGMFLRAGCFFGSRDEFVSALDEEHGDNEYGKEYRAALGLVDVHAQLWGAA